MFSVDHCWKIVFENNALPRRARISSIASSNADTFPTLLLLGKEVFLFSKILSVQALDDFSVHGSRAAELHRDKLIATPSTSSVTGRWLAIFVVTLADRKKTGAVPSKLALVCGTLYSS